MPNRQRQPRRENYLFDKINLPGFNLLLICKQIKFIVFILNLDITCIFVEKLRVNDIIYSFEHQ